MNPAAMNPVQLFESPLVALAGTRHQRDFIVVTFGPGLTVRIQSWQSSHVPLDATVGVRV
jgi:hypothetical protein